MRWRRRLRARYGIAAPRVAVRTHVPWYWRAVVVVALLSVSLALASWVYDAGRRYAGFDSSESAQEVRTLKGRIAELEKEINTMRENPEGNASRLQIERTAQQQLAGQVKSLEEENARLKEDLAFFENLASTESKDNSLSINRLRVEPDAVPGQFRYRMLLALQGGRKDREFKGSLQLVIRLQQDGKAAMIILPPANDTDRQRFDLNFRHFRRIDGLFQVPAGAQVKSVEVRLLQDGTTKASQTAVL